MRRTQHGWAAVELTVAVTGLLLPCGVLALVLPTWAERASAARMAAREAARVEATAPSLSVGHSRARRAAAEVLANSGIDPATARVDLGESLTRGGTVIVRVTVPIPVARVPLVGLIGGGRYTATHAETVDSFRSFG